MGNAHLGSRDLSFVERFVPFQSWRFYCIAILLKTSELQASKLTQIMMLGLGSGSSMFSGTHGSYFTYDLA